MKPIIMTMRLKVINNNFYTYNQDLTDTKIFNCLTEGTESAFIYGQSFEKKPDFEKCRISCKVQCKRIEIESTNSKIKNYLFLENKSGALISLKKTRARIVHQYVPAMTLSNYVANIGGIGSFWIGLNVLTVYEIIVKLVKCSSHKITYSVQ